MGRARALVTLVDGRGDSCEAALAPPHRGTSALPLWHHAAVPLTLSFDLIECVRIGIFVETRPSFLGIDASAGRRVYDFALFQDRFCSGRDTVLDPCRDQSAPLRTPSA